MFSCRSSLCGERFALQAGGPEGPAAGGKKAVVSFRIRRSEGLLSRGTLLVLKASLAFLSLIKAGTWGMPGPQYPTAALHWGVVCLMPRMREVFCVQRLGHVRALSPQHPVRAEWPAWPLAEWETPTDPVFQSRPTRGALLCRTPTSSCSPASPFP